MSSNNISIQLVTENEFQSVPHTASLPSCISLVGLRAPVFVPDELRSRSGMDIVAVLDRSGSMAGSKMQMLHTTVNLMIENLTEKDRLSLVAYDDKVETVSGLIKMDKNGKKAAKDALAKIKDRGSTNLSGGLFQGLEVLKARVENKNEVASVLLLTDGLANAGIVEPAEIIRHTQLLLQSMNNPTSIYTFGFGSDHNSELLKSIATSAHGQYYYMKDTDSVPSAFADCLGGLMSVIAQNIRLTITAADGITINAVHSAFPKTEVQAKHVYTVDIGDLFSEEERDVLVDVTLPALGAPGPHTTLHVSLKYLNVITACSDTVEAFASVERTGADQPMGTTSAKVDQQKNRIETAAAMESAKKLGDQGKLEEARQVLQKTKAKIEKSEYAAISSDLCADIMAVEQCLTSTEKYRAEGSHRLVNKSAKHGMQRACESDAKEVQSYSNMAKGGMRSLFKK